MTSIGTKTRKPQAALNPMPTQMLRRNSILIKDTNQKRLVAPFQEYSFAHPESDYNLEGFLETVRKSPNHKEDDARFLVRAFEAGSSTPTNPLTLERFRRLANL